MIKPHTTQSLGKYIGKPVWLTERRHSATLVKLNAESDLVGVEWWTKCNTDYTDSELMKQSIPISDVLPLLKDFTQLLTPMMHEGGEILPISIYPGTFPRYGVKDERIVGFYSDRDDSDWACICSKSFDSKHIGDRGAVEGAFSVELIQKLQDLGFGAIKCEGSPTGWRDLWGYQCTLYEEK